MLALKECGVTLNALQKKSTDHCLIMDVTLGHHDAFDIHNIFKPNTLQSLKNLKCLKYAAH